jgi:hypothetical protein
VRAEALLYGILVEFEIQPDAAWSQPTAVGTSVPQQAEEFLNEILTKHYLKLCDALNSERRAWSEAARRFCETRKTEGRL